jgi:hypothetical protein
MDPTSCSGCNSSPSPTAKATTVDWVLEASGRGTLGLIVTCLFTIFLCTWMVIHARVYKRPLLRRLHKIALCLKTIIAPEFIAVEALQEWSQAQKMVRVCARLTGGRLKLIHAFYISMLALRYHTPQGARVIWPNQYTWLLEQGLINWDEHSLWGLSGENIRDKSNADETVKLLALGQVCWFVAQSIMRHAHKLPLAQLESMTLSYIPLFAVTYFFWWAKPRDVLTPSVVNLPDMLPEQKTTFESMAVNSAFDDEGIGRQDSLWNIWYLTPRVFEKEAEDKALQEAQPKAIREVEQIVSPEVLQTAASQEVKQAAVYETESGEKCKEKSSAWLKGPVKPLAKKEIVVANWDPEVYRSKLLWPIACIFGASFGALHLISWNTKFPTQVEQWLWRAAALVSTFSMLIFMQFEKVVFRWGGPLTIISIVSPALYLLSRIVMIVGVFAAFRASDPAIYETYVVSTYWIHLL